MKRKEICFLPFGSMREFILSFGLLVCISAFAGVRASFMVSPDTIKIPSDTTGIDTTLLRYTSAPIAITPSIPPSPQAEAFQRVGEYSVDNPYGIPDISIPLYEIDHYGYKIPITLRYIATPIKPGYNYDVTGHGWSLSIGSCISRTIATAPDEKYDFYYSQDMLSGYYQIYGSTYNDYNYQPDEFKAVLPNGTSFHFYMKRSDNGTLQYYVSNQKSWKISYGIDTGTISNFTVTDDSGVKYYFTEPEKAVDPDDRIYNVAWYLTRIELPNTSKPILFTYGASIEQERITGLEEDIICLTNSNPVLSSNTVTFNYERKDPNSHYRTKLLTAINYGSESVYFDYMYGNVTSEYNYLSKIRVTRLKDFHFYYTRSAPYSGHKYIAHLDNLVIAENNPGTASDSLVYDFEYTNMGPFSLTDHWGYYTNDYKYDNYCNLANINFYMECLSSSLNNLINSHALTSLGTDPDGWCPYEKFRLIGTPPSVERRHALPPAYHKILQSITYPKGGRTEFVFENHRFVTATDENGNYVATKKQRRVIEGGGFRIKTITNYDADDNVADIRQFRYGPTFGEVSQQNLNLPVDPDGYSYQHIGYGEPVVDPNVLTYAHFTSSDVVPTLLQYMLLGLDTSGHRSNFTNPFNVDIYNSRQWQFDIQFSPLFFRSLLKGRNAVAYSEITEYHGDVGDDEDTPENTTGKTVYKYDIYSPQGDSLYYQTLDYYGNTYEISPHISPKDYLIEKCDYSYDGSFKLLRKETYDYQTTGTSIYDYIFMNLYSPGFAHDDWVMSRYMYSRYRLVESYLPTGKTTIDYMYNDSITKNESWGYSHDLLTTHIVSGNKPLTTTYTYPSASDTGIPGLLAARNMMSTVLQSRTKAGESGQQTDISGYKIDYDTIAGANKILPSRIYRLNTSFSGSSFEEDQQVLSYTSNGNPVEVVDRSGTHTFYLWSYEDRYLVAEIKNATESQVTSALNTVFGTTVGGLASMTGVSSASLNNLRANSALSGALVTTWTHAPLIGVTSQTDPSGVSTYYAYDGLGRLKEIYRYDGNNPSSTKRVLNQYTYHTSNN